jgi:hypothetical protein
MCEVRVATSNICGCNPPNRCGKRSGADFATSGKGLAKAGIRKTEIPTKPEPSKNHFRFSKLQKIKKRNGFLRRKVLKSSK